jgi:hypothetical protein
MISDEEYKLLSYSSCNFLQIAPTSSLLQKNILNTLSPDIANLRKAKKNDNAIPVTGRGGP